MKTAKPVKQNARRGFTLMEMIAVLAVLVLLSAAIIPMLLTQLDVSTRKQEQATMQSVGAGLQKYVMRTRIIPTATNLLSLVGAEIGLSAAESLKSARGVTRVVLIDPDLHIGKYTTGSTVTGGLLPYVQSNSGSKKPLSPLVLIISSLSADLPTGIVSGIASKTTFTNIWNTAPNGIPSLWTWKGKGEDLIIQRINMAPWFLEVALNQSSSLVGRYALDSGAAQTPTSSPISLWLIRGSALSLYSHTGGSAGLAGGLQTTEIIDRPLSYFYDQDGLWRGWSTSSLSVGADVQAAIDAFNQAPENTRATSGANKAQVLTAMQTYLAAYQAWANAGYPSSGSLKTAMTTAGTTLSSKTSSLLSRP